MSTEAKTATPDTRSGPCARHGDYQALEQETLVLIDAVKDLEPVALQYVRLRWRGQLLFFKCRIIKNRARYYSARGVAVVGAVIVPAFLGAGVFGRSVTGVVRGFAFGISLAVAVATALEEFVGWGKRWRLYREAHDQMKSEGWRFAQLFGPDYEKKSHSEVFPTFAKKVEEIIERYGEEYVTELLMPQQKTEPIPPETAEH